MDARRDLQPRVSALARSGVYLGTSSWKYPGWCGSLYERARYEYRGKFAESRFNRNCLAEYAEVFPTVCVDAAYYAFPTPQYLQGLAGLTPPGFLFGFKVTDVVTIKKYPQLDRFGDKSGKPNTDYLNADLFCESFLKPCEVVRDHVGLLIFEFSRFWSGDYAHGREFVSDLDGFLSRLPKGWPYGVEMRNRNWLRTDYFECLRRHGVTHVYNSWEAMPPVGEQMDIPESRTTPNLAAARFLLAPGRRYEEAVRIFQPYDSVKEPNPAARDAARRLITETVAQEGRRKTFIYVNNRLEGNALGTIAAVVASSELSGAPPAVS